MLFELMIKFFNSLGSLRHCEACSNLLALIKLLCASQRQEDYGED